MINLERCSSNETVQEYLKNVIKIWKIEEFEGYLINKCFLLNRWMTRALLQFNRFSQGYFKNTKALQIDNT